MRRHAADEPGGLMLCGLSLFAASLVPALWLGRQFAAATPDPVEAARVYARWGRTEQARAILREASNKLPQRRVEIERELARLEKRR